MTQQNTYQPAVLAAIDGEIATVQTDYKAALTTAGARLQAAQARSHHAEAGGTSGVVIEEAPPELEPDLAVALHNFETRLDQLKELRDWVKIDPELAHFAARLEGARGRGSAPAAAASPARETAAVATPAARREGVPAALVALVAVLALLVGWLASVALPAAALLPH